MVRNFLTEKFKIKLKKCMKQILQFFDALKKSDYDTQGKFYLERYVSAHAIMISFEVSRVYILTLSLVRLMMKLNLLSQVTIEM